jgi:DNA-binding transcriptional regulator YiaG
VQLRVPFIQLLLYFRQLFKGIIMLTLSTYFDSVVLMNPDELIDWREKHNLSQSALANALGVTRFCVNRWESGSRKIPAFLHLALKCLKVKKGDEKKIKGTEKKTGKERDKDHGKRNLQAW